MTGDLVDPDEISVLLGVPAMRAHSKGEPVFQKAGAPAAKSGYWSIQAPVEEPEDLDGQIRALLKQMTPDLSVWRQIALHSRLDVFCGCFMGTSSEGLSIHPSTLLALGERGIELGLDIYAPDVPIDEREGLDPTQGKSAA